MAAMVNRICECGCGRRFEARVADVRRGWGRFASKSCKARHQEQQTHQRAAFIRRCVQANDATWDSPFAEDKH
jgi:hypothetical protein